MSETIDLTAQMAAFLAQGNAVTVLDYAGNAVGEHRDIDLSQTRIIELEPEKKARAATPKNKHIISAPSLGLPREGSVRAKQFDPVEQDQAAPDAGRQTIKKVVHAATEPVAEVVVPSVTSYATLPDPNPVSIDLPLPVVPVLKLAEAAPVDVLAELRKIRKAVENIRTTVDRFERISRRA